MTKEILILIGAVIASPFFAVFVTGLLNKKKTLAETETISIGGEVSLGKSWQTYALQQQKDKEELRNEFRDQIDELKKDHIEEIKKLKEEFAFISNSKDDRIKKLEGKVLVLQGEVARYKGVDIVIEHAKEIMHTAIDAGAAQVKQDINNG